MKVEEKKKKGLEDLVGIWRVKPPTEVCHYYRAEMRGAELWFISVIESTCDGFYDNNELGKETPDFAVYKLEDQKLYVKALADKSIRSISFIAAANNNFSEIQLRAEGISERTGKQVRSLLIIYKQ